MRPWWLRRAVELLPEPVEPAPERKTIHVVPPASLDPERTPASTPDRGVAFTYQSLAESRLEQIRDLQAELAAARAENTRLRADLGLAGHRLPCGGCDRLTEANVRLENHLETCRAEHLDKDAADALRAQLAMRVGAAQPW